MPRIKLKVGNTMPPMAQRLTLKMPGQTSDTLSKNDGHASDVIFKNESQGNTQDIAGAGLPAGQEINGSPREFSLGGQFGSPRSSTITTQSGSEQQQNSSMSAQGLLESMSNAASLTISTSQNHPGASFDVSSDVPRHSSSSSGTLRLVDILSSRKSVTRFPALANPLPAHYQPHFGYSPMDSLLRRSGQGLTPTEICGTLS